MEWGLSGVAAPLVVRTSESHFFNFQLFQLQGVRVPLHLTKGWRSKFAIITYVVTANDSTLLRSSTSAVYLSVCMQLLAGEVPAVIGKHTHTHAHAHTHMHMQTHTHARAHTTGCLCLLRTPTRPYSGLLL